MKSILILLIGFILFNFQGTIDEQEVEAFHLCLLVEDENGCLGGNDGEEIIRINQKENVKFNPGDQWIYEEEDYFGGAHANIAYQSFAIQDTLFDGVRTKYVLDIQDTFYVEDNKMFFWDEYYQEYLMYYDWQATTSYDIKYYNQFTDSNEMATIVIDSISYKYFNSDSLKVQHIHILNSGTLEQYSDEVYEGIGAGYFGIKFLLGCGLCDNNPQITNLRCFTNDKMSYQFVPYACDSTWLTTGIHEINKKNIIVYPNPTTTNIRVEGIDKEIEYELYNSNGRLVQRGRTDSSIELENTGLYLLRVKIAKYWMTRKLLKIE